MSAKKPTSLGIILFEGYQPLDVWGPLELFSSMSATEDIELSIISHKTGLVSSKAPEPQPGENWPSEGLGLRIGPEVMATHTFADAPPLDILLVPGGVGTRAMAERGDRAVADFVAARYPQLQHLLTVCTGAALAAEAGVLDGRRATSNKAAWSWVTGRHRDVDWVPSARWVRDGNVWTSSGVAAGIDMVYAFLEHYYADKRAEVQSMMNRIEYAPHTDPDWDPFSIVHNEDKLTEVVPSRFPGQTTASPCTTVSGRLDSGLHQPLSGWGERKGS
ncbi:hypothetical protein VTH06DRAFT_335 [Thermothelomyces fergusii]